MTLVSQALPPRVLPTAPPLPFLGRSISFSEKPLLAGGGQQVGGRGPPLPAAWLSSSGVTVLGRQSSGLRLFPGFPVDGLFFSFHSLPSVVLVGPLSLGISCGHGRQRDPLGVGIRIVPWAGLPRVLRS